MLCGTHCLPPPFPGDQVEGRQGLDPESLTLSPQPAAPHQGHFFKRTFQDGLGWDLSGEPGHTPNKSVQLLRETPPALNSPESLEPCKAALVNKQARHSPPAPS